MKGREKRPKQGIVLLLRTEEIEPNPNQPRRQFDTAELNGLADSIRENGILQPLTVRKLPGGSRYELIAGERRLRAAQLAGLNRLPCIPVEAGDEGGDLPGGDCALHKNQSPRIGPSGKSQFRVGCLP